MDRLYKEYSDYIDKLIKDKSVAAHLKIVGYYIHSGPSNNTIGLSLGQLIEGICRLEQRIDELEQALEECTREPKVIACDFDGTLCEENWPGIGAPRTQMIEYLKERKMCGDKLILWTCRVDEKLDEAVDWCLDQGLTFDAINDNLPELVAKYGGNPRKVFADEYWDDRNCLTESEV